MIKAIGGNSHSRATWAFSAAVLTFSTAFNGLYLQSAQFVLLALFFGSLLLIFLFEAPIGGILCLIVSPILTVSLARAGGPVLKYYFVLRREAPAKVEKWPEILVATTVSAAAIALGMAFASFVLFYISIDREWMIITNWAAKANVVLLVLAETALLIVSAGSRTVFLPWIIVVLLTLVVARGKEPLKRFFKMLRV